MKKKRAMANAKCFYDAKCFYYSMFEDFNNNAKRLETGYAEHQPKWPYWVEPRHYSKTAWLDMNVWMIDTFGSGNWGLPNCRWVGSDRKYWFRDESDRTFFILRWS
jgi:hypothetical protein